MAPRLANDSMNGKEALPAAVVGFANTLSTKQIIVEDQEDLRMIDMRDELTMTKSQDLRGRSEETGDRALQLRRRGNIIVRLLLDVNLLDPVS